MMKKASARISSVRTQGERRHTEIGELSSNQEKRE